MKSTRAYGLNSIDSARRWSFRAFLVLAVALSAFGTQIAHAYDSFVIGDIKAVGLQRLDLGTVLTYLPVAAGDELNERTGAQAVRALYKTGLFKTVALAREGRTLIVQVEERPAIASFEIEGNRKIKGEEVDAALAQAGLVEGELFRQVVLDQVSQELRRQYYANGYYDVSIDANVDELPGNRVAIAIEVTEGKVAKIAEINIVGNEAFSDEELLDAFTLEPTKAFKFFQRSDRYSKQQLLGDLEGLSSYYLDRGYLRFSVESVQVSLTPNKKDIYIALNVSEGKQYTVQEVVFTGELILDETTLRRLVPIRAGETFSRKKATDAATLISDALSNFGYAFADVNPSTEPASDDLDGTDIRLNFIVQPGKRVYVRNINFGGNLKTRDQTLRREMRQFEGAVFSRARIERSRVRLARLPFVEEATVDTQPVPGTDDLVDVSFEISERAPGSVQLGVGFSGSQGFLINASLTHSNFFGTGNRVALSIDSNEFSRSFSGSWTDPYASEDGISRTIALSYRESEQVARFASGFDTNTGNASVTWGFPLSEYSALRFGGGLEAVSITTFPNSSNEVLDFVLREGSDFLNYELRTGLTRDTRNRTVFATRGSLNRLNLDLTIPGSDLTVFRATHQIQAYVPIWKKLFAEVNSSIAWTDGYGDTELVPPYERLFAGGSRSVRGYRDGTLGPRDTPSNLFNNPYGGTFRTFLQTELIIPTPLETDNKSTRLSLFFDIGNTFEDASSWEYEELRRSYGIAYTWFTPFLGVLDMSYAFPIGPEPGDELDRFQLTFGTGF